MGSIYTDDQASITKFQEDEGIFNTGDQGPEAFSYNDVFFGVPAYEGSYDDQTQTWIEITKLTWDHVALPAGKLMWETDHWQVTEDEIPQADAIPPLGAGIA